MFSFMVVWIVRAMVLKKIIKLHIDVVGIIITTILLILSGLYFSYSLPLMYVIYMISIAIIIIFNGKELAFVGKKAFYNIKHKKENKK